jgi:hypothetical protein
MAKRKNAQVKPAFNPSELRLIRLAAASQGLSAAAFLKQWGLKAAAQEMRGFKPPTLVSNGSPSLEKDQD